MAAGECGVHTAHVLEVVEVEAKLVTVTVIILHLPMVVLLVVDYHRSLDVVVPGHA